MPKKKEKTVRVRVDDELYDQSMAYAKQRKVTLGMLIRALLRIQTDSEDPRDLPPNIEQERKRPSRRRKSDED